MEEIIERIAKSLEVIADDLKTRHEERKELRENMERMEKIMLDIQNDPFGLKQLKDEALSEKVSKQKE